MNLNRLNRTIHRWASILVATPLLVIVVTGVLLHLKKSVDWIQPPAQRGTGTAPGIDFEQLLNAARSVPEAGIEDWDDVDRIDVRPEIGMAKVRSRSAWEVQVDTGNGAVLQSAYRRSDLIESLHDGSFFHDGVKLGVFLPAGIVLAVALATGVYLFFLPYLARNRKRREQDSSAS